VAKPQAIRGTSNYVNDANALFKLRRSFSRPTAILIDNALKMVDRSSELPESNVLQALVTRAGLGN